MGHSITMPMIILCLLVVLILTDLLKFCNQKVKILINWFHNNCMQANPGEFQAIAAGERTFEKNIVLKISDAEIM